LGTYPATYAAGTRWYGYRRDNKFSPQTASSKFDKTFSFSMDENSIHGVSVTLYTVLGGNLRTHAIPLDEFLALVGRALVHAPFRFGRFESCSPSACDRPHASRVTLPRSGRASDLVHEMLHAPQSKILGLASMDSCSCLSSRSAVRSRHRKPGGSRGPYPLLIALLPPNVRPPLRLDQTLARTTQKLLSALGQPSGPIERILAGA
jgi:hypothetical protein